jgi:hypothetical protein
MPAILSQAMAHPTGIHEQTALTGRVRFSRIER